MKKLWLLVILCLLASFLICSCLPGEQVTAENKRVTFALVIDTRAYNGKKIYATIFSEENEITTVQGVFESYPNTTTHAWAKMTTLEEIETNQRYSLEFFVDMNEDETKNAGDLTGSQHFEVTPSSVWSETKYFSSDFETVL